VLSHGVRERSHRVRKLSHCVHESGDCAHGRGPRAPSREDEARASAVRLLRLTTRMNESPVYGLSCRHPSGTFLVMSRSAVARMQDSTVARTIRFPVGLREKIAADAERCGRSFDGQVVALLRRHYGES